MRVYRQEFAVVGDKSRSVIADGVGEQSQVLDGGPRGFDGSELVVVQVEDPEGRELVELERDIGELVGGEVQLYEGHAFADGRDLSGSNFGASQDQKFQTAWVLDKLADL